MKNAGRETILLFLLVMVVIIGGSVLLLINPARDSLATAKADYDMVKAEKDQKDAIIEAEKELNSEKNSLTSSIIEMENVLLPTLNTEAIAQRLYGFFTEADIPYYAEISSTEKAYETVTLSDGTSSLDKAVHTTFTIKVSGTDGYLMTRDEDDAHTYTELNDELHSSEYVGYAQFYAALQSIASDYPDAVKITEVAIEDTNQGFCFFTATVDVWAYDLQSRLSDPSADTNYVVWVDNGAIATGGIVGIPSQYAILTGFSPVANTSPLYGTCIHANDFEFDRPFAAWNHWGYMRLYDGNLTLEQQLLEARSENMPTDTTTLPEE